MDDNQALEAIGEMLDSSGTLDEILEEAPKKKAKPVVEEPQEEAPDEEMQAEGTDEESDAEPETDEEAEEPADEEIPEGSDTIRVVGPDGKPVDVKLDDLLADTKHGIKVNGKTEFVEYKELVNGYQRQKDYTQKTQEIARLHEEELPYAQMVAYAKKDPAFVEHVANYIRTGGLDTRLIQQARTDLSDAQLTDLMDQDAAEARRIMKARMDLRQIQEQRRQSQEEAVKETQSMFKRWVDQQDQMTQQKIPDYDKTKAEALLRSVGFTDQEVQMVVDHRMRMVVNDALKYRAAVSGKSTDKAIKDLESKRKGAPPPKVMRPWI